MMDSSISRRSFMIGAAGVGAGALFSGRATAAPPMKVAMIGLGGMGRANFRIAQELGLEIVALCDVNLRAAKSAAKECPEARVYQDYYALLERESAVEGVIIATPDHHHAFATMAALERGKHVYCEKPLTHSVYEARMIAEAAKAAGVATQMGNVGQASDSVRDIAECLWAGAIGPVRAAHVWSDRPIWPQGLERPKEEERIPREFDWERWLGPAPARPFHHAYHPFRWRGWYDFGTGALGDIGCHALHPVFKQLKLKHPTHVEATSTNLFEETFPQGSIVRYSFAAREEMPALELVWYDGGLKPEHPAGYPAETPLPKTGTMFVGDQGVLLNGRIWPEELRKAWQAPPKSLPRSPGHWQEWLRACRGGEAAGADFREAGPLTEVVLLGNVALRTGKRLAWKPESLSIPGCPDAEGLLRRAYRAGWAL